MDRCEKSQKDSVSARWLECRLGDEVEHDWKNGLGNKERFQIFQGKCTCLEIIKQRPKMFVWHWFSHDDDEIHLEEPTKEKSH